MTPKDWGNVTYYKTADAGYEECEIGDSACAWARVSIGIYMFRFDLSPHEPMTRAVSIGELKKLIAALDVAVNIGREQVKTEIRRILNADSK